MAEDVRRVVVEVVGRLGRETQLHLDERHRHFWITNVVTAAISVLLLILAVFNVYYVRVLYTDLDGIVSNMASMHDHLRDVKGDMLDITVKVNAFDRHMRNMDAISGHTASMGASLPRIGNAMSTLAGQVDTIDKEMVLMRGGMGNVEQRVGRMVGSVALMRENTRQMARPMGMFPFMP